MSFEPYRHDPDVAETLPVFDWSAWLGNDTIATSTFSVSPATPPPLAIASTSNDAKTATVRISGGLEGSSYVLTNRITTAGGDSFERSVEIRCRQTPGTAAGVATVYASIADLVERFGADEIRQLSDREIPASGFIDNAVTARALADADAMIDGYIAARYALPLAAPPAELKRLACDVARYLLHRIPTEEVRQRYEDARSWLTKVAEGKFGLGLPEPASSTNTAVFDGPDRTFSRNSLSGL